jgi:hypothetical protein
MGYALSELGNLPVQPGITLYIFVIGGGWRVSAIEENFMELARRIGPNAVIAKGFDQTAWSAQVCQRYLGKDVSTSADVLPALLLTDSHPKLLNSTSLRLLVPLRDAEARFGGVDSFFDALTSFAVNRDKAFLDRFQDQTSFARKVWSAVELKPNMFGFGVNIKELATACNVGKA